MNSYSYEELSVGTTETFEVEVTDEMLRAFCEMSGDVNPLHTDADFAKSRGFDSKVVYGMLTSSFYSTLVGVYLPGERCILQEISIKFRKPVYVGDVIRVTGRVIEKTDFVKRVVIKAFAENQTGVKVNTATISVGL
ncbi:MAG: MaoC family dehydratase [Ruminococcaceae bacterium]|nr:MaoC family dehydratase [Oscillospiraceae bacterium]